jgi:hypothetical protein
MANNYYQTTVEPTALTLTRPMVTVLAAHGAGIEGGEQDTALDQVARGDRNRRDAYVFFEEGWRDIDDLGSEDVENVRNLLKFSEEEKLEFARLVKLDELELFREILLQNPTVPHLEIKSAHYCSRMRPGEFGGMWIYVTRTHYLLVGDHSAKVNEDGTIEVTAKPVSFEEESAAILARKAEVVK